MPQLIFCRTMAALEARPEPGAAGRRPFLLLRSCDIRAAIMSLKAGMDVLALAEAASDGWWAPKGTEAVFDADLLVEEHAGLRARCQARIMRPLFPDHIRERLRGSEPPGDAVTETLRKFSPNLLAKTVGIR